ncbi:MAG: hypothetical protein ACLP19_22450 [Xanthobacteraceae bacterium]
MIATAATLAYDYPAEIVAFVASPKTLRPRARYSIPSDAIAATSEVTPANADTAEFAAHLSKLNRLATDASLWTDAGPPSDLATAWARLVLDQLQSDKLLPTKVVASAEGGVGLCFVDGIKYADIECLNSGTILGVISDKRARPVVWEVEQNARGIARATERIREFIHPFKTGANAAKRPRS